jgi:hypothetical protein
MRGEYIPTTAEAAAAYDATINIFEGIFRELKELSKKKSDSAMSTFKVEQINRILGDIKAFLKNEPEAKYLDLLNDEQLPQIGDAVVVMAQYEGALKGFRERHYGWDGDAHRWFVDKKRAASKALPDIATPIVLFRDG